MTPSIAGKLHVVDEMCVMAFSDDLDYWGIEEVYMEVSALPAHPHSIVRTHTMTVLCVGYLRGLPYMMSELEGGHGKADIVGEVRCIL